MTKTEYSAIHMVVWASVLCLLTYDIGTLVSWAQFVFLQHSKSITQIYHQDVALLKTDNQLPTEYIIQFPDPNEDFTGQTCTATGWGSVSKYLSRDMWFPTMWHFDKCRLRRACAAFF